MQLNSIGVLNIVPSAPVSLPGSLPSHWSTIALQHSSRLKSFFQAEVKVTSSASLSSKVQEPAHQETHSTAPALQPSICLSLGPCLWSHSPPSPRGESKSPVILHFPCICLPHPPHSHTPFQHLTDAQFTACRMIEHNNKNHYVGMSIENPPER